MLKKKSFLTSFKEANSCTFFVQRNSQRQLYQMSPFTQLFHCKKKRCENVRRMENPLYFKIQKSTPGRPVPVSWWKNTTDIGSYNERRKVIESDLLKRSNHTQLHFLCSKSCSKLYWIIKRGRERENSRKVFGDKFGGRQRSGKTLKTIVFSACLPQLHNSKFNLELYKC